MKVKYNLIKVKKEKELSRIILSKFPSIPLF